MILVAIIKVSKSSSLPLLILVLPSGATILFFFPHPTFVHPPSTAFALTVLQISGTLPKTFFDHTHRILHSSPPAVVNRTVVELNASSLLPTAALLATLQTCKLLL